MPMIEVRAFRIQCDKCKRFYSASKGKSKFHDLNHAFWKGLTYNGWIHDNSKSVFFCRKCKLT